MSGQTFGFASIRFLHTLFTALWMGGMLVVWFSLRPVANEVLGRGEEFQRLMRAFQQRHGRIVYYSMAGLVITGMLMAQRNPNFVRLFSFGTPYSTVLTLKHLVVIVMIGMSLYRSLVLGKPPAGKQGPAGANPQKMAQMRAARQRLSERLLQINAWLVVLVLFLSGLLTALGTPVP